MSKKIKCPCCGKEIDSRGFKVHVFFCCGTTTMGKLLKFLGKK